MTDNPRLTEEALAAIERRLDDEPIVAYTCASCGVVQRPPTLAGRDHVAFEIPRLVAEVRRLLALVKSAHDAILENGSDSAPEEDPVDYEQGLCLFCGAAVSKGQVRREPHATDCPWPAMVREVKP